MSNRWINIILALSFMTITCGVLLKSTFVRGVTCQLAGGRPCPHPSSRYTNSTTVSP